MEEKLTHFYNIGPIQAKKILQMLIDFKLLNIDKIKNNEYTLSDLRRILINKKIFEELSKATKTDLTYNPLRVIPRPIITLIDNELHKIFNNEDNKIKFNIAGSYIRGKQTSGDIDMVLSTKKTNKELITWKYFMQTINKNSKYIKFHEPFAEGIDKVATLIEVDLIKSNLIKKYPEFKKLFKCNSSCKVNIKMDIFLSNLDDYHFAMLFAIGSGSFNIRMRSLAKKKGYLLNHHGLYKKISENVLEKINIKTEQEIFEILGMKYRPPLDRLK